jgi:hypothetical protein
MSEKLKAPYDSAYYNDTGRQSAAEILRIMFSVHKPAAVADFGCGIGVWLEEAEKLGATRLYGIDGDWVDRDRLSPSIKFQAQSLEEPALLPERVDLALCLEVAEHLPESAAPILVDSLCRAADIILFSAAIPGQGGLHHVNEQWPSYWYKLFEAHGYQCADTIRPLIWNNGMVYSWYKQNCLIYMRPGALTLETGQPLSLVHPIVYAWKLAEIRKAPTLRSYLGGLLRSVARMQP